jgi:hypothetical protein
MSSRRETGRKGDFMPTISLFFGIKITMNYDEHNPPHFHVRYAEYQATILILDAITSKGFLPNRQLKLVLAWCELHRDELMQNWELTREGKEPNSIAPLA